MAVRIGEAESEAFLRFCENAGLKWMTDHPATEFNPYRDKEVCVLLTTITRGLHRLAWDFESFLNGYGLQIVSWEEFFRSMQADVDAETIEVLTIGCA